MRVPSGSPALQQHAHAVFGEIVDHRLALALRHLNRENSGKATLHFRRSGKYLRAERLQPGSSGCRVRVGDDIETRISGRLKFCQQGRAGEEISRHEGALQAESLHIFGYFQRA